MITRAGRRKHRVFLRCKDIQGYRDYLGYIAGERECPATDDSAESPVKSGSQSLPKGTPRITAITFSLRLLCKGAQME